MKPHLPKTSLLLLVNVYLNEASYLPLSFLTSLLKPPLILWVLAPSFRNSSLASFYWAFIKANLKSLYYTLSFRKYILFLGGPCTYREVCDVHACKGFSSMNFCVYIQANISQLKSYNISITPEGSLMPLLSQYSPLPFWTLTTTDLAYFLNFI